MSRWIQDAGHGGSDPGAVKYGQKEKEWTLEAALYVDERLRELGISSDLTRDKDETLIRDERTSMVSQYDKGISHHFNAGGGTGAEFIHSIYSDGQFEQLLEEEFKAAGYPFRRTFTRQYPGNDDLDYYYMNRETGGCRVTIVEYDFLDGATRQKLQDKNYRIGMYECVIKAICRDEGVEYVAPNKEVKSEGKFFKDVPDEHWAAELINNYAAEDKLSGYEDGTFKPNQPITRAEAVKLIDSFINN